MLSFQQYIYERHLDVDGKPVTIVKNPSEHVLGRMVMNSKEGFARTYHHGDGHFHAWSGDHAYEHAQFMHDHGIAHTSDNYAGAGVVHSVSHAMKVARDQAHFRKEARAKKKQSA